jgi:hypothetical protein
VNTNAFDALKVSHVIAAFQHDRRDTPTATRTTISAVEMTPDHWLVTNHLEGDFPGGQVDLTYEFRLGDGLITRLVIAP